MILTGDSREILPRLEPETIDCIITSPPYYQLRDYNVSGQIGTEQTPEDYITTLTAIFAAAKTLLKPRGTLWINIGDTYKNKNLLGIPWKLAFALQNNGWILRQDIIWAKPNPMPESVCNRCTKSHEYLFLLSKSPDYYFDMDGIKEKARYQKEDSFNTGSQCRYGGKKILGTPRPVLSHQIRQLIHLHRNQTPAFRVEHPDTTVSRRPLRNISRGTRTPLYPCRLSARRACIGSVLRLRHYRKSGS